MPKAYERERDALIRKGVPAKKAKKRAAIDYNRNRKKGQKPVTRGGD